MTLPTRQSIADLSLDLEKRAIAGDDEAFAGLYKLHVASLINNVKRFVRGDHAKAEDITQEAFIRARKSIGAFKQESTFLTWITHIARNLAVHNSSANRVAYNSISLNGHGDANGESVDGEWALPFVDPSFTLPLPEDPMVWLERVQSLEILKQCIEKIESSPTAVAVGWEYIKRKLEKDLRESDIALAEGLSDTTVRSRMGKAKGALKKEYAQALDNARGIHSATSSTLSMTIPASLKLARKAAHAQLSANDCYLFEIVHVYKDEPLEDCAAAMGIPFEIAKNQLEKATQKVLAALSKNAATPDFCSHLRNNLTRSCVIDSRRKYLADLFQEAASYIHQVKKVPGPNSLSPMRDKNFWKDVQSILGPVPMQDIIIAWLEEQAQAMKKTRGRYPMEADGIVPGTKDLMWSDVRTALHDYIETAAASNNVSKIAKDLIPV